MKYQVEITHAALEAIRDQAKYIAVDCQAPLNARRWLEQIWDTIDGLDQMPARHALAEENAYKAYEVRRALAGNYLILFTIDEPLRRVWVIGFRHGNRRSRPADLPDTPDDEHKP